MKNCQFVYTQNFTSFKALKNPKKSHKVIELLRFRIIYSTPLSDSSLGFFCTRHQHHMEASHASSSLAHVYNITCQACMHHSQQQFSIKQIIRSSSAAAFHQSHKKCNSELNSISSYRWPDCNSATNRLRLSDEPQWYDRDLACVCQKLSFMIHDTDDRHRYDQGKHLTITITEMATMRPIRILLVPFILTK